MLRCFILLLVFAATSAQADSSNKIPFHDAIAMKVGQTAVIAGYRGECGKRPTGVDPNRTRDTKLGTLSNGRWGIVRSRTCNGWTPAVEIRFTAKRRGRETIETRFGNVMVEVR